MQCSHSWLLFNLPLELLFPCSERVSYVEHCALSKICQLRYGSCEHGYKKLRDGAGSALIATAERGATAGRTCAPGSLVHELLERTTIHVHHLAEGTLLS